MLKKNPEAKDKSWDIIFNNSLKLMSTVVPNSSKEFSLDAYLKKVY